MGIVYPWVITLPMTLLLGAMAGILGIPILMFTLECFASLLPHPTPAIANDRPRIDILIPAHNEALGLALTLKTIFSQLVEGDRVIVIADNCDDQTANIAQSMGAIVTERFNLDQQGKGYALAHGLTLIADNPPEVVVMFDADCTVHPGTLDSITRIAIAEQRPVQALYLLTQPAHPEPKAAVSELAFLVKNWVRPRGLDCLGLPCFLTGTGMAFPWAVINSVSLGTSNIVEDMQLAVDLAIAGYPPKFCLAGQVTGHLPQHPTATASQRMRWEHGHLNTLLTQVPRLWKAACHQKRLDLVAMAGDLSIPPLSLLVMLWAALTLITGLSGQLLGLPEWPLRLFAIEGLGLLSSILVVWLRFGRDRLPLQALLAVPLYLLWKIPLYLAFLLRPQTRWIRTERDAPDLPKLKIQTSSTIAYLINQYPKVSHSFIRREIAAVEAGGINVVRFSLRSCASELVDEADHAELKRTRIVLDQGLGPLLIGLVRVAFTRPRRFGSALALAMRWGGQSDRGLIRHIAYLAEACVLLQWFAEASVAHVHAHFGSNSTAVAALCHVLGGPTYSFTVHGPDEFDQVQAIGLVEKIQRASFVVTISSFSRSQLYRWCDSSQWAKIQIVHCGLDHEFLPPKFSPIPIAPRLVCVGRLCAAKGQLLLIEAVHQLVSEGIFLQLVLVGDGELRPAIETRIAQLNMQDHVEITGWADTSTVRQHLLASRAMVLPSFAEGLPVVIMEALALGRPVITTYISGIPELVESGVSGWLVPAGSIDALTAALRSALQAPVDQLEAMGRAGASRVLQRHHGATEAAKLVQLFQARLAAASVAKRVIPKYSVRSEPQQDV